MIVTAKQDGLAVCLHRTDGLRVWNEWMPTQEALDIYHALHALFQLRDVPPVPAPHEVETVSDIERA